VRVRVAKRPQEAPSPVHVPLSCEGSMQGSRALGELRGCESSEDRARLVRAPLRVGGLPQMDSPPLVDRVLALRQVTSSAATPPLCVSCMSGNSTGSKGSKGPDCRPESDALERKK
jgi:hypothetical protein